MKKRLIFKVDSTGISRQLLESENRDAVERLFWLTERHAKTDRQAVTDMVDAQHGTLPEKHVPRV